MKQKAFALVLFLAVWLVSAVPAPIQLSAPIPEGLTAADWQAIHSLIPGSYLKASNTRADDFFGFAVALDGDTAVVGAYGEDSNATGIDGDQTNNLATDSGAAYVFIRTDGVWSQQAYLKASNTEAGDYFGWAVAISGDTILIAAVLEDSNSTGIDGDQINNLAPDSGAVYIFTRTATVWTQQAYLKASNTDMNDQFGKAVSLDGDTAVVGAHLEDSDATGIDGDQGNNSASASGAAYVFARNGAVWSQQAYLKASNTGATDQFGWAVDIDGETVLVGARYENSNATGVDGDQGNELASDSGAAYLFTRSGEVWSQQAYLKASNTGIDDEFGRAVALSGDTAVVAATYEDSNATGVDGNQGNNLVPDSGAAYVFTRNGGVWSQQAYLKASNTGSDDRFAYAVAVAGDRVVVGAVLEDSNATGVNGNQTNNSTSGAGAAYVFVRTGGVWSQQAYLKASNTGANDQFGVAVAVADSTAVVGAYWEDSNAIGINGDPTNNLALDSGAVYTFEPDAYSLTVTTTGTGAGFVMSIPAGIDCGVTCTVPIATGTVVILTATADLGSTFTDWSGDVVSTTNPVTVTMDSDKFITATFSLNQYELNVTTVGNGTAAPNSGTYDYGTVVTLTATADLGSTFTDWSGDVVSTTNPITITMDSDKFITATFSLNQYELNVATVGNGTAVPNSGTYDYGTVVTLTATADLGSTFTDWSGDVVSTTNPVTVTMDSDKFITATFSLNQYELNVATLGNGTAAPNSGTYDYGTVVTLTATADTGSAFTDWSGDVVSTANPVTVTMNSDKFITATFETTNVTHTIYLPIVVQQFAIQLGAAYPPEPNQTQGTTFYANTVVMPAQLPAGGQYYLSSSSGGLNPVVVDDLLVIEVNGQPIFTQEFGQPPTGLVLPLEPSVISQMAGQTVIIYYRDVYGDKQGATTVWLIWVP